MTSPAFSFPQAEEWRGLITKTALSLARAREDDCSGFRSLWPWRGPVMVYDLEHKTVAQIKRDVAEKYAILVSDLEGQRRSRRYAWPRQEAFTLIYAQGRFSLPLIGRYFGNRDHTTVLHGIRACIRRHHQGVSVQPARTAPSNDNHLLALCRALAQREVA